MANTIAKGSLVRFTRKVTRFVRDVYFKQTDRQHDIPTGTVGIVLGEIEGAWSRTEHAKRSVIFTSSGFRVCELPENLEVLCSP
jgi:hypothetical protein